MAAEPLVLAARADPQSVGPVLADYLEERGDALEAAYWRVRARLVPVEAIWYDGWKEGEAWPGAGYRDCCVCQETVIEDIWADRLWRQFYRDPAPGLDVCEHCLEKYAREEATDG